MSRSVEGPSSQMTLPKKLYGYDVLDFIGEGAGSVIYLVSDPLTSQVYAMKQVVVRNDKQLRFVEQLVNEFEVSQHVSHPTLRKSMALKINRTLLRKPTDAGLVMELVEGTPCDTHPPKDVQTALDIFRQTAGALESMHAQGYVHCDLKPNNILVCPDGSVKVIDLGQACKIGSVKKRIQGTPDFIAPEQVRCEPVTVQTDVYNFGATFYWALTGRKVPTLFTLKKSDNSFLVSDSIPAPHELNPKVPLNLSNLVMECVRAAPQRRPANMTELIRRLDIVAHGISHSLATAAATAARAASARQPSPSEPADERGRLDVPVIGHGNSDSQSSHHYK